MERKKWTPKVEITDTLLKFREKRKWQLALRRYVLEKNAGSSYACYFGLSIDLFRNWIEIQFSKELNWQNFGSAWRFDHIVPVAYFNFSIEEDLKLCWNFINIKVDKVELNEISSNRINPIALKPYFAALYKKTGYSLCLKMIDKICRIEGSNVLSDPAIEDFIIRNRQQIEVISSFNKDEFNILNKGMSLDDILLEREIIKKFG